MKVLMTAAALALALMASTTSAYACKDGDGCCDCCKDQKPGDASPTPPPEKTK